MGFRITFFVRQVLWGFGLFFYGGYVLCCIVCMYVLAGVVMAFLSFDVWLGGMGVIGGVGRERGGQGRVGRVGRSGEEEGRGRDRK